MVKKIKLFIVPIFFLLAGSAFAGEAIIRVNILNDAVSFKLGIKSSFLVKDTNNKILLQEPKGFSGVISSGIEGIKFGQVDLKNKKIRIVLLKSEAFSVNNRKYEGELRVILKDNTKLALVNHIDLEDYLKSVVPSEAPWYWPYETLKAQAVIARTFALYQARENKWRDYDLTDSAYSQVYSGNSAHRFRATRSVEETKGLVLTYKGKIFPAYFHSTCGGHTEDATNLWDIDHPCLKGVECPYCKGSPHFFWFRDLPKTDVIKKFKDEQIIVSDIRSINIVERNNTGRVKSLELVTPEGNRIISAKQIRKILGADILRSLNFSINVKDNSILVEGFGWGHGVGFCQWGGYFLAREGKSYKEILEFYYPGSAIKDLNTK